MSGLIAVKKWFSNDTNLARIESDLPRGWSAEKVQRTVMAIAQADELSGGKLKSCTPISLTLSFLEAAHLGLDIQLGEAYLIPYGKQAKLSIGYKGLIKLAKKSGELTSVVADVVRQGDEISYHRGTEGSRLEHRALPFNDGQIVGAYALFTRADGSVDFEVLSMGDLSAIRSKAANNSPAWREFFGEMAKKAAIRRGLKRYELNPDDMRALQRDDEIWYQAEVRKTSRVADALQIEAEPVEVDEPEDLVALAIAAHNDGDTASVADIYEQMSDEQRDQLNAAIEVPK
jgi:recombination protein RecT